MTSLLTTKVLPLLPDNPYKGKWLKDIFGRAHTGKPDLATFQQYDLGISFLYPHILNRKHLNAFSQGVINIHPAYLPFNRGAMPNVWTIVDRTPGGVTIHWMDKGIDTGPIIAQGYVDVEDWETGEEYYKKLLRFSEELFTSSWAVWRVEGIPSGVPQSELEKTAVATVHKSADVKEIDDLEKHFGAQQVWDILDVLRSRTFTGYESAYVRGKDGKKIYVRISLEKEE